MLIVLQRHCTDSPGLPSGLSVITAGDRGSSSHTTERMGMKGVSPSPPTIATHSHTGSDTDTRTTYQWRWMEEGGEAGE